MKNPEDCNSIEEIREAIDEIDYNIMKLFGKRYDFVKGIVKFKTDEVSVIAESRQHKVIKKRREWAGKLGLDPDLFEEIYRTLITDNVQKELEILNAKNLNQV